MCVWRCLARACRVVGYLQTNEVLDTALSDARATFFRFGHFVLFVFRMLHHHQIPPSGTHHHPTYSQFNQPTYRTLTYSQLADHFNAYGANRFAQRYLVDDSKFIPGGPIFAFTGAEGGDVTRLVGDYGTPAALAKSLGGVVLYMECRFFGKSIPVANVTGARTSLGLLSVEQILRDYIALITDYRDAVCGTPCADSKIVTFGGSLAGTLSALMRIRAPWLIHASWASSTPLFGFVNEPKINQYAWRKQVTDNWKDLGTSAGYPHCVDHVRSGFAALSSASPAAVASAFHTCEAPFEGNSNAVQGIVWGLLEGSGEFVYPESTSPIPNHCKAMSSKATNESGLTIFASLINAGPSSPCLNLTHHGKPSEAGIAWNYMACTEVIHPIGSNNVTDFFPPGKWSVASLTHDCWQSMKVIPQPMVLPQAYGFTNGVRSLKKHATRIMFAYGTRDPWARLGVGYTNLSSQLPVVVIEGGSHCADTASAREEDTKAMKAAREQEARIITAWLKEE